MEDQDIYLLSLLGGTDASEGAGIIGWSRDFSKGNIRP